MFAGVAIAAALLAVVFAGCALAGASSLQGVDGLERQVQITAYVTLVVVALFAGGAAWQWRWYRNALAGSGTLTGATAITGEIAAWTAAAGTAVTWWLAHRASRHVAVLELVDLDSAVLLSILGASCAIVAVGCRGAAALGWRQAVSSTGADRPESRRTLLRSAVATLLVGALVGVLLVLAQRPALDLGGTMAAPTQVRPWPTDVGETAYRIKIDGASPVVRAAGPGFVVAAGDQLTAYDGATGAPRWHFGLTALGEPLTHDGYRELAVYRSGPDDTVVVTGELLTVGLDAMTGRLLWRTPTATYAGVGDDGPHRVRIIEDARGDGIHELTVTEPRTGTVRWRSETRCASAVGADATWLVRSVCDDSGTVEVVDLENRRGRQVTVTAPEHGEPDYVWSFGDNLFAVVYGVPELGDPGACFGGRCGAGPRDRPLRDRPQPVHLGRERADRLVDQSRVDQDRSAGDDSRCTRPDHDDRDGTRVFQRLVFLRRGVARRSAGRRGRRRRCDQDRRGARHRRGATSGLSARPEL